MQTDSDAYLAKKRALAKTLTIFGRKPVSEALADRSLRIERLHLADSNQASKGIAELIDAASARAIPVVQHTRESLARISRNRKQDQGVALDIECPRFADLDDYCQALPAAFTLLALDNVTNPQNLGMIVRSVCASPASGLLLPAKGCARLDSLVIKASAGTLFRTPVIRCPSLANALPRLSDAGADVLGLAAEGQQQWPDIKAGSRRVFVLGNETHGLSSETRALCSDFVAIPMARAVESLNVSVAASLMAFASLLQS